MISELNAAATILPGYTRQGEKKTQGRLEPGKNFWGQWSYDWNIVCHRREGRKVAVLIDPKKHGAQLEEFWEGLISESRRKQKGIPLAKVKADLIKSRRFGA